MGVLQQRAGLGLLNPFGRRMADAGAPRLSFPALLAAAAASCLAGVALAELPAKPALTLTGAAAIAVLLAAIGVALRPSRAVQSQPRAVARTAAEAAGTPRRRTFAESRGLARSRAVYYLGSATIGLLTIRPALAFTLSDWLYLLSLALAVVAVVHARKVVGLDLPPLVVAGAGVFAVGGLISSIHAVSPLGSAAIVVRMLYLTVPWFWAGTLLLRTQGQIRIALSAWVYSAAVSAAGAVAQLFLGNVIPGGSVAYGRATGFTSQVNSLGALTAIAFVPSLMLAVQSRGRARVINWLASALIVAGLALSGSIGGLLAAVASLAIWLVASRRARRTLSMLAVIAAGALLMFASSGGANAPNLAHRFSTVTQSDVSQTMGGTLYSRIDVYRAAWHEIGNDPFVGVGLDAESSIERLGYEVHNIVLQPWYTAGIFGVLGIFILLGSLTTAGFRVVRRAQTSDERLLALALYASLVAFVADAFSEPILYVRYGWAPAALLLALRAQQQRAARPAPW